MRRTILIIVNVLLRAALITSSAAARTFRGSTFRSTRVSAPPVITSATVTPVARWNSPIAGAR
jgi:hypothetical protein